MSGPIRFARIAEAYSTVATVSFRRPVLPLNPYRDSVQISREAQEKSNEFFLKLRRESSSENTSQEKSGEIDPDILCLPTNAPRDQVRKAYIGAIKKYHPDNFAGLCPEFRKLAEEKSKQINLAYKKLTSMQTA